MRARDSSFLFPLFSFSLPRPDSAGRSPPPQQRLFTWRPDAVSQTLWVQQGSMPRCCPGPQQEPGLSDQASTSRDISSYLLKSMSVETRRGAIECAEDEQTITVYQARLNEVKALTLAAAAAPKRQRKTRSQREQHPPTFTSDDYDYDGWEPADDEDDDYMEGLPEFATPAERRTHLDKVKASEIAWRPAHLANQQIALAAAHKTGSRLKRRALQQLHLLQQDILAFELQPVHVCREQLASGEGCTTVGAREVHYVTLTSKQPVSIPIFSCSGCVSFEMPAMAVDCAPSSAQRPQFWIDGEVMRQYHSLHMHNGTAATAFCQALSASHASQSFFTADSTPMQPLDDRTFAEAQRAYRAAQRYLEDPDTFGMSSYYPGWLGMCPACAAVPAPELSERSGSGHAAPVGQPEELWQGGRAVGGGSADSEVDLGSVSAQPDGPHATSSAALPRRPMGITADGNQKGSHYQNCGKTLTAALTQAGLHPLAGYKYHSSGDVNQFLVTAPRPADVLLQPAASCDATLLCARPYASRAGAATDVKTMIGVTCLHSVPAIQGFVSFATAEQFGAYDFLLSKLLPRGDIVALFLDVNCRYSSHLRSNFPDLYAQLQHMKVGWLHSQAGHNISCQLKFGAMYAEGLGRGIGENLEQLWAHMKPIFKHTRYMSLFNRHDVMEDALEWWAQHKYGVIASVLCQTCAHTRKRAAVLRKELDDLLELAADKGWSVAVVQPYSMAPTKQLAMDQAMEYVKLLSELDAINQMQCNGAAYVAAMQGAAGQTVLGKIGRTDYVTRLQLRIAHLESRLGISAGQRWEREHEVFQENAKKLREMEVEAVQLQLEQEVMQLAALKLQRHECSTADNSIKSLDQRIRNRTKKARELLIKWQSWLAFMQPDDFQPTSVNEELVLRGELPWNSGTAAHSVTVEALQLKRHRLAAELDRCAEELRFLPGDARNVLDVYDYHQALLSAADSAAAARGMLALGMQQLLRARLASVQRIAASTKTQFIRVGLLS